MKREYLYRKALEMLKGRIDLYGKAINPTQDDMRFAYKTMQKIIDNALSTGDKLKNKEI